MTLTQTQRKRLAREARGLAMECVEGTAPEFGRRSTFQWNGSPSGADGPCCAVGHAIWRAADGDGHRAVGLWKNLEYPEEVNWANEHDAPLAERFARLVFPFLAWADELESAP